jgi:hypothetical protein
MTHDFIINTEDVNEYKFRVLTDGIDYTQYMKNPIVLFMHEREFAKTDENKGSAVIGRCVKLYKRGTDLIASIEFDLEDPFAAKIAGKVERGFIRMASMYAPVLSTSSDSKDVLSGQMLETVTGCKLEEISIVDVGGNDKALKLSKENTAVQLQKINQKTENKMSELKTIALALGKPADASESDLLNTVNDLKLSKSNADAKAQEWKGKYIALQKTEAEKLVNKAVSLGLIPEDLKDVQVKAFETDFDGQSVKLAKLIDAKETENETNGVQTAIGAVINLSKGGKQTLGEGQDSFDYLQKHNAVELSRIRTEEPQKYVQLVKGYSEGVRYTPAK